MRGLASDKQTTLKTCKIISESISYIEVVLDLIVDCQEKGYSWCVYVVYLFVLLARVPNSMRANTVSSTFLHVQPLYCRSWRHEDKEKWSKCTRLTSATAQGLLQPLTCIVYIWVTNAQWACGNLKGLFFHWKSCRISNFSDMVELQHSGVLPKAKGLEF